MGAKEPRPVTLAACRAHNAELCLLKNGYFEWGSSGMFVLFSYIHQEKSP